MLSAAACEFGRSSTATQIRRKGLSHEPPPKGTPPSYFSCPKRYPAPRLTDLSDPLRLPGRTREQRPVLASAARLRATGREGGEALGLEVSHSLADIEPPWSAGLGPFELDHSNGASRDRTDDGTAGVFPCPAISTGRRHIIRRKVLSLSRPAPPAMPEASFGLLDLAPSVHLVEPPRSHVPGTVRRSLQPPPRYLVGYVIRWAICQLLGWSD
jgi:hypothetical protein